MFLSAAIGILVSDGKMQWDDLVTKYLPNFNPVGNDRIAKEATIRHALAHSIGLSRPQVLLLGPRGSVASEEYGFVDFLNHSPTENEEGQRFNSWWLYNNFTYGLVGLAVQEASGQRYSDFVRARILDPLGMNDTAVSQEEVDKISNQAHGYAKLENGDYSKIDTANFTTGHHTPILAAMGMRSSVRDMLKWSKAVLAAGKGDQYLPLHGEALHPENPLRHIDEAWSAEWVGLVDDDFNDDFAYGKGWYRGYLPTVGLGYMGVNHKTSEEDPEYNMKYILGRDSEKKFFVGHNGNMNGYASALYLFPETNSGVIALANGMNLGDAADFAAKIMLQALFDLQPHVDILELAKREAHLHKKMYNDIIDKWLAHRNIIQEEANLEDYVGNYEGYSTMLNIILRKETGHLALMLNSNLATMCDLELFNRDQFSFQPTTRDAWLSQGMIDWDEWFVGVLRFKRDNAGKIEGLSWEYEPSDTAWFKRIEP
ncbi:hypothetical protein G7Z17_g774 [Cylindrodendrum hubeiense]|uniref:Beta-lactamase-related domain-containing protein n=1 Tax=Cylindrodendrum hubeiense TaxID=595255 RepID=A0A9P5HP38_9HYPO|nr:hypothetical protein G7Z17_g774 [Cylindrodendrum hubeiense]